MRKKFPLLTETLWVTNKSQLNIAAAILGSIPVLPMLLLALGMTVMRAPATLKAIVFNLSFLFTATINLQCHDNLSPIGPVYPYSLLQYFFNCFASNPLTTPAVPGMGTKFASADAVAPRGTNIGIGGGGV